MTELQTIANKILTIARAGLTYSQNEYDLERYQDLEKISFQLLEMAVNLPIEKLITSFSDEHGYLTPKVDVRGVVVKDGKILLVQEKSDGKWCLPGGWADWGYSAAQNVEKEVWEEAGMRVKVTRLLALQDKAKQNHPPDIFYVYKVFMLCEIIEETLSAGTETLAAGFFSPDSLPVLSVGRTTREQLQLMYKLAVDPDSIAVFD